jgi:hypothetical protein
MLSGEFDDSECDGADLLMLTVRPWPHLWTGRPIAGAPASDDHGSFASQPPEARRSVARGPSVGSRA